MFKVLVIQINASSELAMVFFFNDGIDGIIFPGFASVSLVSLYINQMVITVQNGSDLSNAGCSC